MNMKIVIMSGSCRCLVIRSFLRGFLLVSLLSSLPLEVSNKRSLAVLKGPNGMSFVGAPFGAGPSSFGAAGPLVLGDLGFEDGIL